jgi:threonine synthase
LASEVRSGRLDLRGKRIVAVCTGHGLKDPDIITRNMAAPEVLPPSLTALEDLILGDIYSQ